MNEYSDYNDTLKRLPCDVLSIVRSRSSPAHCCLFFFPGCTNWKCRAVFLGRVTLEVALVHANAQASCTSSISTYIAKDKLHTATLGEPFQVTGHLLNAAFFRFSSCCALWLQLPVQPTQPLPQCWESVCSRALSCLSANSAAEKCYRFLCDDVLTFDKLDLLLHIFVIICLCLCSLYVLFILSDEFWTPELVCIPCQCELGLL